MIWLSRFLILGGAIGMVLGGISVYVRLMERSKDYNHD